MQDKERFLCIAKILENSSVAPTIYCMKIFAPEIAKVAKPGQFVMIYLDKGEMLLPRPISICHADEKTCMVEFMYQVVGAGTDAMSKMEAMCEVRILGPLGNGFYMKENLRHVAIVGGGIGVPPLYYLAKALKVANVRMDIYLGFRSMPILVDKFGEFATLGENLHIATDDGSFGHHGRVTDVLKNQGYDEIMACGPQPLLQALAKFSQAEGVPCQISMEQRMACGIGTCVGCAIKTGDTYARCCCEGPVFYSDKVEF